MSEGGKECQPQGRGERAGRVGGGAREKNKTVAWCRIEKELHWVMLLVNLLYYRPDPVALGARSSWQAVN